MRVVHLSSQHRPGDVRIFWKECRTLADHGYEVHLLIRDAEPGLVDGVQIHRFEWPRIRFRPQRIGHRLMRMYCQARNLAGDLYHIHDPELIVVGLLLKRDGARVVYDVHEDAPREPLTIDKDRPIQARAKSYAWRGLETLARRGLDGFVCATPAIARNFPAAQTATVRNFPLLSEMMPARGERLQPLARRFYQAVYVGGMTRPRGIAEMLAGLAALPAASPLRLQLAGDFSPPEFLDETRQSPGWQRVDYHGFVGRPDVRRLLMDSRLGLVLLHPEPIHLTSLPVKLFEYMAAGMPVVVSNFPYWRSIVERIGCGMVVNPLDPSEIAAAMTWLLDHPVEAQAMGQRGTDAVCHHYNWELEARQLLDLYQLLEPAHYRARPLRWRLPRKVVQPLPWPPSRTA